jgi:hypothetical protein
MSTRDIFCETTPNNNEMCHLPKKSLADPRASQKKQYYDHKLKLALENEKSLLRELEEIPPFELQVILSK